jgi:hypothetical protein
MPVVFHKFGKWSYKLREKHRVGILDNTVLRKIFGPKQEETTGEGGKILY